MRKDFKEVLFWNNERNSYPQYPMPKSNIYFWRNVENKYSISKKDVITYLENGIHPGYAFRGMSPCRICTDYLGNTDLNDGTYMWPMGAEHYIKYHDIIIPIEFILHIKENLDGNSN